MPNGKDNACNHKNFEMACAMLRYAYPKRTFDIQTIYLDFGAGMRWETIVTNDYQILCPRDWDLLNTATRLEDIIKVVHSIQNEQDKLLKVRA